MRIFCNGVTDVGGRTGVNQDSFGLFTDGEKGIFVVADGMGGHTFGEVASTYIVKTIGEYWTKWAAEKFAGDHEKIVTDLKYVLQNASAYINYHYNQESICGSTVVVLLIYQGKYTAFWVGDSRIYQMDEDGFDLLTQDDIWDNLSTVQQEFSEEERLYHRNHGKLTQAMGATSDILIHTATYEQDGRRVFMLCTDGLYQYCPVETIADGMRESVEPINQKKALQNLMELVYQNGAGDNITGVIITA